AGQQERGADRHPYLRARRARASCAQAYEDHQPCAGGAVMAASKIKKGDKVVVLSGKDKGRTGEVVKAMPKEGKVIVSGVNVHARHRKPTQLNPQGGIERKEAPLNISKVAIATADGKPTRVRFEERDGKKVRVAAKTGELIHG